MFRLLLAALVASLLFGCGVSDASLTTDSQAERFGNDEEALARTADTWDPLFAAAGERHDVPPALLKSLSFSMTRYENVQGEAEFEAAPARVGVMGLSTRALGDAARLAGVSVEAAKTDPAANIDAAAALLSARATQLHIDRTSLRAWAPVLGDFAELTDVQARAAFVQGDVFATLTLGVGRLGDGLALDSLRADIGDYASTSQALDRAPDYGSAVWRPSPNFDSRGGATPKFVVIHSCEGTYASCWSWLDDTASGVSAHYVVNPTGTEISQLVRESDRAWHIGATYDCANNGNQMCDLNGQGSNAYSVGIEHGGFATQTSWPTAQIDASAKLVCSISRNWNIPRDRYHVVAHAQLQPYNRTDPGAAWPWSSYLTKINSACGTPTTPTALIIDSNNANNDTSKGYIQLSSNWTSSSNVSGYYGSGYWWASTAAVSDGAAFWFKVDTAGPRTIDAWWTAGSDRSTATSFVAFNAAGTNVGDATANQSINGGKWNTLGTFTFTAGWNKVVVSRWQAAGKVVIADAIRVR